MKPRSYEEVVRHLEAHAKPLHVRPIAQIDRRLIAIRLADIAEKSGPAAANRVRASLSAYFAWMLREGLLDANPVLNTNKAEEGGARERVLDDKELATIWRALGGDQYSSIVKLLILTGARRDEIASLRWSEIDLDQAVITLPGARTKNKREFSIPLTDAAIAVLEASRAACKPTATSAISCSVMAIAAGRTGPDRKPILIIACDRSPVGGCTISAEQYPPPCMNASAFCRTWSRPCLATSMAICAASLASTTRPAMLNKSASRW